jgi:copper homeostasis protein
MELAGDLSVTFHRAFDMTRDPMRALETLVDLGVGRVLSSGQRPSAIAGSELLARLVERAGDRIVVMPGVGIDAGNIAGLIRATGAREYHVYAPSRVPSAMRYRNEKVFMGSSPDHSEYEVEVTDSAAIQAICTAAHRAGV